MLGELQEELQPAGWEGRAGLANANPTLDAISAVVRSSKQFANSSSWLYHQEARSLNSASSFDRPLNTGGVAPLESTFYS